MGIELSTTRTAVVAQRTGEMFRFLVEQLNELIRRRRRKCGFVLLLLLLFVVIVRVRWSRSGGIRWTGYAGNEETSICAGSTAFFDVFDVDVAIVL